MMRYTLNRVHKIVSNSYFIYTTFRKLSLLRSPSKSNVIKPVLLDQLHVADLSSRCKTSMHQKIIEYATVCS
jgi:hypothetical protein